MPTHGRTAVQPAELDRRRARRRADDQHRLVRALEGRLSAFPLSAREREVTALVARGHSNREIARHCFISEQTVKDHLKHTYRKLGVRTRTALIAELLGLNHNT